MMGNAEEMAGAIRSAWIFAAVAALVVVVVGLLVAGPPAAGLAAIGGVLGVGNLQLAAFALNRAPIAFLGSSLPRLALITLLVVVAVMVLGPIGVWALLGLLATHLAQVGAVARAATKASR